jgi:hypothetical protein
MPPTHAALAAQMRLAHSGTRSNKNDLPLLLGAQANGHGGPCFLGVQATGQEEYYLGAGHTPTRIQPTRLGRRIRLHLSPTCALPAVASPSSHLQLAQPKASGSGCPRAPLPKASLGVCAQACHCPVAHNPLCSCLPGRPYSHSHASLCRPLSGRSHVLAHSNLLRRNLVSRPPARASAPRSLVSQES